MLRTAQRVEPGRRRTYGKHAVALASRRGRRYTLVSPPLPSSAFALEPRGRGRRRLRRWRGAEGAGGGGEGEVEGGGGAVVAEPVAAARARLRAAAAWAEVGRARAGGDWQKRAGCMSLSCRIEDREGGRGRVGNKFGGSVRLAAPRWHWPDLRTGGGRHYEALGCAAARRQRSDVRPVRA